MSNKPEEFSMEKYNEFLKTIKAGSPVHKINFTLASPNAIAGMYLITMNNVESYIDEAADYEDLEDNTLLVFESRHVVECCQIIYGCLNILAGVGMFNLSYETFINEIIDTTLSKPSFYKTVINELVNIADNLIRVDESNESKLIFNKFTHIIKNIWFVPYGRIDEMATEAIEEFKKQGGVDSNE
jgi:hypothetical protein